MNILAIDDEKIMLKELVFELNKVFPGESIYDVRTPDAALEWVNKLKEQDQILDYANTSIATVSSKGVIKGKKKGTCYVYVYAQNGVYKKIKVTV